MLLIRHNENHYQTADLKYHLVRNKKNQWIIGRGRLRLLIRPLKKTNTYYEAAKFLEQTTMKGQDAYIQRVPRYGL